MSGRAPVAVPVAVGVLCGLAWSAGFRAYMVEIAGAESHFEWVGTFGAVLLPGAIAGGLLGWAEAIRRGGGRRGWRWLALAPLAFAIVPFLLPRALADLLTKGLGGGAIAVAVLAVAGGHALSGRGPLWGRAASGALAAALAVALAVAASAIGGSRLALTGPRGAWVAVLAVTLLAVLALASSIPQRQAEV